VENALERGEPYVRQAVEETANVRDWVLRRIDGELYSGPVNFVTVKMPDAETAAAELDKMGFVVRVLGGKPLCESCLRFTLAPQPVIERFLRALSSASKNIKVAV
jgi:histidinol-phosphate aminotransferase